MEVTGATSSVSLTGALTQTTGSGGSLGKDEFLTLLVTQLRYQDPLSPMENEAFVAQLAQFSSLEQMQALNAKIDASTLLTQSLNNSAAAGLIGRHVRANGDTVRYDGETTEVGYFLQAEAQEVTMTLYDGEGRAVRTLHSQEGEVGAHRLSWDGRDEAGLELPPGDYEVRVEAKDAARAAVPVLTVITGKVDGVTFQGGSALLLVNGREVPLSSLLEVYEP